MPAKRKTVGEKALNGNPGKRPLESPKLPPGVPPRPGYLTPEAISEWDRIVKALDDIGAISVADQAFLADYCMTHARLVEVEKQLNEAESLIHGRTDRNEWVKNPLWSVANQLRQRFQKYREMIDRRLASMPDKQTDDDAHGLLD